MTLMPISIPVDASRTIVVARVLAVFCMIFVHVWPRRTSLIDGSVDSPYELVIFFFIDVLGRASVPLLSVVSGALLVVGLSRRGSISVIVSRLQNLIAPMLFWNLVAIIMVSLAAVAGVETVRDYSRTSSFLNGLFAIWSTPANYPLFVLRDLFLCALVFAVAWTFIEKRRWISYLIVGIFILLTQLPNANLLLRENIIFFFSLGAVGALNGHFDIRLNPFFALILFFVVTAHRLVYQSPFMTAGTDQLISYALETTNKFVIALCFWQVCRTLAKSRLYDSFVRVEPYVFLLYCIHFLVYEIVAIPMKSLVTDFDSFFYMILFFTQPISAVIVAVSVFNLGQLLAPRFTDFLTGAARVRSRTLSAKEILSPSSKEL